MPPMLTDNTDCKAMAKGRSPDRAPGGWLLPLRCCGRPAWAWRGWHGLGSASWWAACCLSPDLDTRSTPPVVGDPCGCSGRPYRKGLSHAQCSPTSAAWARLDGLATWRCWALGPQRFAVFFFGGPPPQELLGWAGRLWREQRPLVLSAAGGAGGQQAWLHLIQDANPMPRAAQAAAPSLEHSRAEPCHAADPT